MKEVFAYVIGLGAAVMMPVIFTVLGTLIGIKFSKSISDFPVTFRWNSTS